MGFVFSTPAGLVALFAMAVQASVAVILALASGLSEMHKDLLVGFAVGFPALTLVLILVLLTRAQGEWASSAEEP